MGYWEASNFKARGEQSAREGLLRKGRFSGYLKMNMVSTNEEQWEGIDIPHKGTARA